ncbi:hypothetical protein FPV67DRAFT_1648910 [Lyophyllum atratum]|nr:hypothetical protein FPV67DRAFT_1648910 [Lyophyllum atratum]
MATLDPYDTDIDYPEPGPVTSKRPRVAERSVKDPIHDMIPISPRLSMFIDTVQFQRLRNIKQLGTSYYVWLGASHNRFEHCIGVAHLAREMASHLQSAQPELRITDRDIECVEVAGLCHDLGHGPWSHVWDGLFIPRALPGSDWQHEHASVMMFDALVKDNDIPLDGKDDAFIKALISGEPKQCSPDEKPFLFDIVANKRNGLDVDKFDYITRDSHMIGDKMSISLSRIINSARVLDAQICYDIKDVNLIYNICETRFKLHKMVYNHKAAKAIEYMIIDALMEAEPYMKIAEQVYDPERYLHLTDHVMTGIEASTDPNLAPARAIFQRIRTRDLYKLVDFKSVSYLLAPAFKEHITPAAIVKAARALPGEGGGEGGKGGEGRGRGLREEDVICDFSLMHYGMKEKNPLDYVKFYSKRHPDHAAHAERGVYSCVMPEWHAEFSIKIFTKNVEYFGIVQAGYRACLAALRGELSDAPLPPFPSSSSTTTSSTSSSTTSSSSFTAPPTSTPPAPDTPSTPPGTGTGRTFSRAASWTFGAGGMGVGGSAGADAKAFEDNAFTTVEKSFVPCSPSRGGRGRKGRGGVGGGNETGKAFGEGKGAGTFGVGKGKEAGKEEEGVSAPLFPPTTGAGTGKTFSRTPSSVFRVGGLGDAAAFGDGAGSGPGSGAGTGAGAGVGVGVGASLYPHPLFPTTTTTGTGTGTGRTFSRATSLSFGGGLADAAEFADNAFTTVGKGYVPGRAKRGWGEGPGERGAGGGSVGGEKKARGA